MDISWCRPPCHHPTPAHFPLVILPWSLPKQEQFPIEGFLQQGYRMYCRSRNPTRRFEEGHGPNIGLLSQHRDDEQAASRARREPRRLAGKAGGGGALIGRTCVRFQIRTKLALEPFTVLSIPKDMKYTRDIKHTLHMEYTP